MSISDNKPKLTILKLMETKKLAVTFTVPVSKK